MRCPPTINETRQSQDEHTTYSRAEELPNGIDNVNKRNQTLISCGVSSRIDPEANWTSINRRYYSIWTRICREDRQRAREPCTCRIKKRDPKHHYHGVKSAELIFSVRRRGASQMLGEAQEKRRRAGVFGRRRKGNTRVVKHGLRALFFSFCILHCIKINQTKSESIVSGPSISQSGHLVTKKSKFCPLVFVYYGWDG